MKTKKVKRFDDGGSASDGWDGGDIMSYGTAAPAFDLQGLDTSGLGQLDLSGLGDYGAGTDGLDLSNLGDLQASGALDASKLEGSAPTPNTDYSVAPQVNNSSQGSLGRLLGLSGSQNTSDIIKAIAGIAAAYGTYKAGQAGSGKGSAIPYNPPAALTAGAAGAPNAGGSATGYGPAGGYNHANYAGLTAASNPVGLGYTPRVQVNPNIPNYYTYGQGPQASFYAPSGAGAPQTAPTQSQAKPITSLDVGGMAKGGLMRKYAAGGGIVGAPASGNLSNLVQPRQWTGPPSGNAPTTTHMAHGGLSPAPQEGALTSATSRYVKGPGDGTSDSIPARLADGEYIMDAQTVAAVGNGSNDAGAKKLDAWREQLRKHKGDALAKGKMAPNTHPDLSKYLRAGK